MRRITLLVCCMLAHAHALVPLVECERLASDWAALYGAASECKQRCYDIEYSMESVQADIDRLGCSIDYTNLMN